MSSVWEARVWLKMPLRASEIRASVWGLGFVWEFPKSRGTLFWGPYNKDPTI